jgi:GNAT superfamily N-acetyltransferase
MAMVADDPPLSIAELADFAGNGRAWVYPDDRDRPVAYLLIETVDGAGHIEQVSVHPDHSGRGIGAALIEVAADWAREQRMTALTLTTYVDVPWNTPYYRRLGFEVVPDDRLSPGLLALRRSEAADGLDRWPRVVMRRRLAV